MNLYLSDDGKLRVGWRFAISAVVVFLADYASGNLAATLAGDHPLRELALYAVLELPLLLLPFLVMSRILDQPKGSLFTYLGLPRRGWLRQSAEGMLLGLTIVSIAVAVMAFFFRLSIRARLTSHSARYALLVLLLLFAGAMAEELSFRGYPFQRLVEGIGPIGAIVVLSALFGAIHLGNPHISDDKSVEAIAFCNTLLIGIVLALGYLRTRALWFPFGLHMGWNLALGFIYGLPVSGLNDFSVIVHSRVRGPEWFLGGAYGLEAGFLGSLMILIALGYVIVFLKPAVPERRSLSEIAVNDTPGPGIQPSGNM